MAFDGAAAAFVACARGQAPVRVPVFALGLEFDMRAAGVTCAETRTDVDKPEQYLPMNGETLRGFRIPDAGKDMRLPIHLEMIRRLKAKLGDTVCVAGRIAAPFSSLALVYGMDALLTGMLLDPGLVRDHTRFFVEHQIAFGKAQFEAGADVLWLGDCVAGSRFISPEHYEEFALGPAAEVASALSGEDTYLI